MRDNEQISDSLLYMHRKFDGERRAEGWLQVAYNAYCRLAPFRKMRAECKSYAYGKQYERQIVYNGRHMTKEQYLKEKGIPALQTNILGKIKRVVQGQFRMNDTAPVCNAVDPEEKEYADIMSALLRQNMKLNRRSELDARAFEEYLISGLPIYKISWAYRRGKLDVFTDYVNPNFVFFPDSLDFNLADIRFCGLLHDLDFSEVLALFSHSDSDDVKLKKIYNHCLDDEYIASQFSRDARTSQIEATDFYYPSEFGKCRVIELWTKERRRAWFCKDPLEGEPYFVPYDQEERIKEINRTRLDLNIKRNPDGSPMLDTDGTPVTFMDPDEYAAGNLITYERRIETYWYYRYLSPDGFVLEEGQSPYWNGSESFHPFVFKPYPYIDGEFHPFISEIIPSQEYFNYYMVALDFYIRNAAKGVLMIDEESLSDSMSIEDIASQYVKSNGVILYTSKRSGNAPDTKTASSIPGGFDYIIQLSRSMVEDVSGVQPALQGKSGSSESGVLYQAKAAQASSSILDLINTFNAFLTEVAYRIVKVMQCFYTGPKAVDVAGESIPYNMDTMYDVDVDISISEDSDSPVYRALTNQLLMAQAEKGLIPFKAALEAGNFPNSSKIIAVLERYEKQLQEQQMVQTR